MQHNDKMVLSGKGDVLSDNFVLKTTVSLSIPNLFDFAPLDKVSLHHFSCEDDEVNNQTQKLKLGWRFCLVKRRVIRN